jgi:threonine/homoserine/homoserine lactone efflux protein
MYGKGFRFGIILQLSVGPVCLFVFNTAGEYGFLAGLTAVMAVALVDALYISLAGMGIASVIQKKRIQRVIRVFGFLVLLLFGVSTILGALGLTLFPGMAPLFRCQDEEPVPSGDLADGLKPAHDPVLGRCFFQ